MTRTAEPAIEDLSALVAELRALLASFGERVSAAQRQPLAADQPSLARMRRASERAARLTAGGARSLRRLREAVTAQGELIAALYRRLAEAERIAFVDGPTGVLNRAAGERRLELEVARARAERLPLALLICDIDHFKAFNDRYGHETGDHVLRLVAHCLEAFPGERRVVFRHGGEEFVLAVPGLTGEQMLAVARLIALAIASRRLRMRGTGEPLDRVTISGGVAGLGPGEDAKSLVRRADAALYEAKRAGRNRVLSA